jgi:hypothetical protein
MLLHIRNNSDNSPGNKRSSDRFWGHFLSAELSSRLPRCAVGPERTRISYIAALTVTYAAFGKESRMKFANATNLNRKSGVA